MRQKSGDCEEGVHDIQENGGVCTSKEGDD